MMSNRIWALGAGILVVAVLALGYLLGVSPLLAQAKLADDQRATVDQNNQAQIAQLALMKADFDRLDELEAQVGALRLSVPGEVDSDVVYSYFSRLQAETGALVESIVTDEAEVYGAPIEEGAAPAPAETAAPAEGAETPDATGTAPATVPGVADLYTMPVTITFQADTPDEYVLAFAGAMQTGPRLFLVTSVSRPKSSTSAVITAYMFVISDPDETPGAAVGELDEALSKFTPPAFKPWGKVPAATPAPTDTETPAPDASATPTPTPTGTPTP